MFDSAHHTVRRWLRTRGWPRYKKRSDHDSQISNHARVVWRRGAQATTPRPLTPNHVRKTIRDRKRSGPSLKLSEIRLNVVLRAEHSGLECGHKQVFAHLHQPRGAPTF